MNNPSNNGGIMRLTLLIITIVVYINSFAYDFEVKGIYYNKLSNNTVECCGGGQSPNDATYRQTEVTIPSKVRYSSTDYEVVKIADYAWSNCTYAVWIQTLNLPETITEIGKLAFRDCSALKNINLPEGLISIGDGAFQGPRIADYVFPKSLKSLGSRVFNRHLKNVIFTSSEAPIVNSETFFYQNGGQYDIFIPDDFCIYVPNEGKYTTFSEYLEYLHPICIFPDTEYTYGGVKPAINYLNQLPENHSLTFDFENVPIDAGSYDFILSGQIDGRFEIDFPLHLSINKASLNIKIHDKFRNYGDANPEFTYNITGLQNNENINDVIIGGFHLHTDATKKSDIGIYPISLSSMEAINYNITLESGTLSVLKSPLSISIGEYSREYGLPNNNFTLHYKGLKNNEIAPKWDKEPEFITDANIKTDVGTYIISVDCHAHNYEIVSAENGNLLITKAPLSLNANNCEKLYYTENPEFTFSLSGLRNNDDINCLTHKPSFHCSATLKSDCGIYKIIPTDADAKNYNISYQSGTLTILPQNIVLIASNLVKEYGDPVPILRYDCLGLKGEDTPMTALIDEPILTTTATESSPAGEYAITISGGTSKNYTISYRQGTLSVTKAPLTVIAEDAERPYGDNNPTFSRSFLGFKLTDSESTAFSSLPRITCSATKTSDVGEYPIVVEGGTSRNYEVTHYQYGTLTITKASLVLTANNKSRLYHEVNPQFDFTLSGLKNNDTKSTLTTTPTYSCAAELTSDAGQYAIIPSGAESKNYMLEYHNGTLTVNQRPLTVSVGNYTRKYNTDNPNFKIIYSGFVNNEDATVLTHEATSFCSATKTSDVGTYTITPQGGEATNYSISQYINGTLIIEKANQVLTWEQDLSEIEQYSQIALTAISDAGLSVSYEMSPNNVATLYNNNGTWYLDCFGSGAVNIRAVQNGDKNHNAASMLSKTLIVMGTGGDPSNPQIFLNVENAGTLPDLIAENRKYQIKNLRLTGYLNGTDINFLREMSGSDSYGNSTPGVLETLDISGCTIVSGGRSYYKSCQTYNNKVSDYMFYNCKQLVNLMLPENTTEIEDYAFADCDRLSVISIPDGVKSFGVQSFRNDISLLRIPMPSGLISIKDYAFIGCNGISEITIPVSVTTIGEGIVKGCQNISKINVAEGNNHFTSEDGVLYTSNFDELLIFPVNHESNSYVVKAGTKTIAPYAFVNSKKLSEVTLPSTLTNIGEDAFIGCVNLSSLLVKALNPPVCYNDCFEAVSKTRCELIVPKGCYSYYWVAPVWSDFNKIKEADFSDVVNTSINNIAVVVENHCIVVKGLSENDVVNIFQIDGTLVHHTQSTGNILRYNPATPGTYLVVAANKTYKLLVR